MNVSKIWKSRGVLFSSGVILILLISVLLSGALSCSSSVSPSDPNQPHIQFQQEIIDLGTASPGDELHAEFLFKNVGGSTLIIEEISTEVATEGC